MMQHKFLCIHVCILFCLLSQPTPKLQAERFNFPNLCQKKSLPTPSLVGGGGGGAKHGEVNKTR